MKVKFLCAKERRIELQSAKKTFTSRGLYFLPAPGPMKNPSRK